MDNSPAKLVTNPDMPGTGITSRIFWEERASTYASPYKKEVVERTNKFIDLLEEKKILQNGVRILDIGSGPGTFSLPLSSRGANVTALDISEKMLDRLSSEARSRNLPIIKTIRTSWKSLNPVEAGLTEKFDVVFSALSPAIESEEDILKMEQCSTRWCVCIAAGNVRRHFLYETAMRMFDVPFDPKPDICTIRNKIEQMGRVYSYVSFPVVKMGKKTIDELSEDLKTSIEAQGRKADRNQIFSAVSFLFKDMIENGRVANIYQCSRGMLCWERIKIPHRKRFRSSSIG